MFLIIFAYTAQIFISLITFYYFQMMILSYDDLQIL